MLQAPAPASEAPQHWQLEAIKGYIVAYYYAALTNVSCQAYVPAEQMAGNDILKGIIDASYAQFYALDHWLAKLDPHELKSNPNAHLFQEARDVWKPWVKDWLTISKKNQRTG